MNRLLQLPPVISPKTAVRAGIVTRENEHDRLVFSPNNLRRPSFSRRLLLYVLDKKKIANSNSEATRFDKNGIREVLGEAR